MGGFIEKFDQSACRSVFYESFSYELIYSNNNNNNNNNDNNNNNNNNNNDNNEDF